MQESIRALYQEIILEHGRKPRNFHKIEHATCQNEGFNPLCGDQVTLYVQINNQKIIQDISFEGKGCTISLASASLMSEALRNKTLQEAQQLFMLFHEMVTKENIDELWLNAHEEKLHKLKVMFGVRDFPMRIKCSTMVWHALKDCLSHQT